MGKLLLLFILVPLLDAWLLFQVGGMIGFANTIALVVFTGVLGAWLFRLQGARTWDRWQASLAEGRVPEEGVLGGAMLLLGGALLVTPGVITDVVGLLLLLPPTRRLIAAALRPRLSRYVRERARSMVESPRVRVVRFDIGGGFVPVEPEARRADTEVIGRRLEVRRAPRQAPQVIDADFEVKSDS